MAREGNAAMKRYIIIASAHDPWHNLAVEALLFEMLGADAAVLYLWQNQHTVVIGRHQNAWQECRVKLLEDEGGRLARRSTGGGAVYHDLGNLNFTFILPRPACDVPRQLRVIQAAVGAFGIETAFTGRNDLVASVSGGKFSGNAFRYTEAAGMHHGTLLVDVDMDRLGRYLSPGQDKLKAKGIRSVRSRVCNLRSLCPTLALPDLTDALVRAFEAAYGPAARLSEDDLDAERLSALEALYASWDFRLGKSLPFDARLQTRFPWGGVTLELSLRRGAVADARVWSDAMDEAMIARVGPALIGQRYENRALARALRALSTPQSDDLAAWIEAEELG